MHSIGEQGPFANKRTDRENNEFTTELMKNSNGSFGPDLSQFPRHS